MGGRLKIVRKDRGLSQKDFAALIGTSQGYICDIEKGKKSPGGDLLLTLRLTLGIDLNWLLTGSVHVPEAVIKDDINRRYL